MVLHFMGMTNGRKYGKVGKDLDLDLTCSILNPFFYEDNILADFNEEILMVSGLRFVSLMHIIFLELSEFITTRISIFLFYY